MKLLLDLHRFVAVGNVMEHTAGNIVLDKRTVKEIKAAVGFSQRVSPRCALLFRSNQRLRTVVRADMSNVHGPRMIK